MLHLTCTGKKQDSNNILKKESYAKNENEWEELTIKDGDTLVFNSCDAQNVEISIRLDKIFIQYGQENEEYIIKQEIIKKDTIVYTTEEGVEIQCIKGSVGLSTWIIPDDLRILCGKKGLYKKVKLPYIYCQNLQEVKDIVKAEDLKKEVTITNIGDFIKSKYPSNLFEITNKISADANGDGIMDHIYVIHYNGNGSPHNQEDILLILLTIDNNHFEVALDRNDIISGATTLIEIKAGTIYYQNELYSARDKIGFNYVYDKNIGDWVLTYVNEAFNYSDFEKNYDISSYRDHLLKFADQK